MKRHVPMRQTREQRFWARVEKTSSCWFLRSKPNDQGYGIFDNRGQKEKAHRVAWELTNGPIPDGLNVLHNCPGGDNRRCCNPAHLWLGTLKDNSQDMMAKGTNKKQLLAGEDNPKAKLTWVKVREIRERLSTGGVTQLQLAAEYGCKRVAISYIATGRNWKEPNDCRQAA